MKYLGDFITEKGTTRENIHNRRNKGWGRIADIVCMVSEMPDQVRMMAGLKLQEAKLCNGVLFSTEVWSYVSEVDLDRLEVVDTSLLRQLVDGHSK